MVDKVLINNYKNHGNKITLIKKTLKNGGFNTIWSFEQTWLLPGYARKQLSEFGDNAHRPKYNEKWNFIAHIYLLANFSRENIIQISVMIVLYCDCAGVSERL
jgi:hypothetical protein